MKTRKLAPGMYVADYRAEDGQSYLAYLDKLSESRGDGHLHAGHVYYIQNKLSEEDDCPFLKAAIQLILDKVPSVFPLDLPEQVESGKLTTVPVEWQVVMKEIQSQLILPFCAWDVIRVIKAAREYEALGKAARA
jgi:hypothetical protein